MRPPGGEEVRGMDDGAIWRDLSRRLALALGQHRADMHQASKRPCATCRYSKAVLDEYLAAVKAESEPR